MYEFLKTLDRRWIFLLMALSVAIPMIGGWQFPESPSPLVRTVYDAIEDLPDGSIIWMAYDYDPGSQGELHPMALAFTRHCALKRHKMYYMTLWPPGTDMIQQNIHLLEQEFPDLKYGTDYVNLGFRSGMEGPIKVMATNLHKAVSADVNGTSLGNIPMMDGIRSLQDVDLLVNVSAGYPGTKEWVLYASTPYNITTVAGCTGVQAAGMYPYIPNQLLGMLGAIKGAAEYEQLLLNRTPELRDVPHTQDALQRMGPQLFAHVALIGLIVLGNVIYFIQRRRGEV